MPVSRGPNFESKNLDIVGGSTYGRYNKISSCKTTNMFVSDTALVPYAGYEVAMNAALFGNSSQGRALFASTKLNKLVLVQGSGVYLVDIIYRQLTDTYKVLSKVKIGSLATQSGVVYIEENNKPQIGISDGVNFYIYDPAESDPFINVSETAELNFTPGYLTFHEGYFLLASINDRTTQINPPDLTAPLANNFWRLSALNDGTTWDPTEQYVGALTTKPDNTQAVVRVPSRGNMIYVMGKVSTEAWFFVGGSLFPYVKNNQMNLDYGCLQPATVASLDETVAWLAINESSGPIIMASDGSGTRKITTDGIDYLFSTLTKPQDSQAFLYRQDGHLFYHINFYTDNLSLFYDFTSNQFYNATDHQGNYFIASQVAFFKNQYYFVTKKNSNLYAFDTEFYTYNEVDSSGNKVVNIIPRSRICSNVRDVSQDYMIINDVGFTIESGQTNYNQQDLGELIFITEDDEVMETEDDEVMLDEQDGNTGYGDLSKPSVDFSSSIDGGSSFSAAWRQYLPAIGQRKNKLQYWQIGIANDFVAKFQFNSIGRVVVFSGEINVRR